MPDDIKEQHFTSLFGKILSALLELDASYLLQIAWPIFYPMLVGAIPTGVITLIAFYYLTNLLIGAVRENKFKTR